MHVDFRQVVVHNNNNGKYYQLLHRRLDENVISFYFFIFVKQSYFSFFFFFTNFEDIGIFKINIMIHAADTRLRFSKTIHLKNNQNYKLKKKGIRTK